MARTAKYTEVPVKVRDIKVGMHVRKRPSSGHKGSPICEWQVIGAVQPAANGVHLYDQNGQSLRAWSWNAAFDRKEFNGMATTTKRTSRKADPRSTAPSADAERAADRNREAEAKASKRAARTSTTKRTRKATDPVIESTKPGPDRIKPAALADKYGIEIYDRRHQDGKSWLAIAVELDLTTRERPEPEKKWASVVVWNAYVAYCENTGREAVRKVVRGNGNGNGHTSEPKTDTGKTGREVKADKDAAEDARQTEQRQAKRQQAPKRRKAAPKQTKGAAALADMDDAALTAALEGHQVTFGFANAELEPETETCVKVTRTTSNSQNRRVVSFLTELDGKSGKAMGRERHVYVDQILNVK